MNTLELLDELDDILSKATSVPLMGKRLVDADHCLDIIAELRANLPDDLKEAEMILNEQDQILHQAEVEAEDIVKEAQRRFEVLVSESSVLQEAKNRGAAIVNDAQKQANEIADSEYEYADNLLADVEKQMSAAVNQVRKSRAGLNGDPENNNQ